MGAFVEVGSKAMLMAERFREGHSAACQRAVTYYRTAAIGEQSMVSAYESDLRDRIEAQRRVYRDNCCRVQRMSGDLVKLGGFRHNWLMRRFIIEEGRICYFPVPEKPKFIPCGDVTDCRKLRDDDRVKIPSKLIAGRQWLFSFTITTNKRQYFICADSESDRHCWICAVRNACRLDEWD
eukprot:NODE_1248_length_638_cov_512.551783_g982_i0.p1 GENE.NODE_1248_length_638_cov_512.551783_g982_i0~~NODE_1248_length_638_cov_512.551783_g982_i0.p1  ORF type:complete len:188 (+),score=36.33 NODE_1248_length_638_cov_512.551783_g982_i0:27-566(+)